MKRYMKINTHRQHGRIVQSHHRILCNNPNCRRSSISLSLSLRLAFSPSLRACVTSPAQSLLSVSQIQNLPLSAPARSVCHANPSLPPSPSRLLLLLCWLCPCHSPSLAYLLPFFSPFSRSFLSVTHSLVCFFSFPSPTRSFLSLYPQPSVLLLCPCLLISSASSPVLLLLLLSHPDSLTPPPPASVTPANFPLPFASLSCRSPSLPPSLSSSVLFLHVGELTGPAGTTGRGSEDVSSLSPLSDRHSVT